MTAHEIGTISTTDGYELRVHPLWAPGLAGLQGFSHLLIVWHAHRVPAWVPSDLVLGRPYRLAPDRLGVFATRSPHRPNPIAVSVVAVRSVDVEKGVLALEWTDAEDGTPVLDIKPYHRCTEVVAQPRYPQWCAHWPANLEASAKFDWEGEFLFLQ